MCVCVYVYIQPADEREATGVHAMTRKRPRLCADFCLDVYVHIIYKMANTLILFLCGLIYTSHIHIYIYVFMYVRIYIQLADGLEATGVHAMTRGWPTPSDHVPVWARLCLSK